MEGFHFNICGTKANGSWDKMGYCSRLYEYVLYENDTRNELLCEGG